MTTKNGAAGRWAKSLALYQFGELETIGESSDATHPRLTLFTRLRVLRRRVGEFESELGAEICYF